tara:strand:- start:1758 stop:2243 length:486 start_codon:yes stop_codon:yes gene_type:complete
MPVLFQSEPGAYVRIKSGTNSGSAIISVEDLLNNDVLLVTQFTFSQSTKVQYKSTLGGSVYVYPMGDNMGDIKISGLASFTNCRGAGSGGVGVGFRKLADYYAARRASNIANVKHPIKIVLPGLTNYTTNCFLESLSISGVDPENRVFGYELGFKTAPARN